MKQVLIISQEDDYHSIAVAKKLELLNVPYTILNNREFPEKLELSLSLVNGSESLSIISEDGVINVSDCLGVWWRRPEPYKLHSSYKHPSVRRFVAAELSQSFRGSLSTFSSNFINPIDNSRRVSSKIYQLKLAQKYGLKIPNTIVTTSPREASDFIKSCSFDAIYKTFTGADFGFYETRKFSQEDLEELDKIKNCPMIIQEHIEGSFDIRVTIVDEQLFAAKIMYKEGRHPVDGRIDRVPIHKHELPDELNHLLLRMIHAEGLRYATVDMRYSQETGYVFFEINPEGQFLWIEIETGLEISMAIAKSLSGQMLTSQSTRTQHSCAGV
ncbi:MvdC/MvdD family ATP grasp protein [Pseudoalteromonas sp. HF66]|uniref:MvdC/MvdD family ATP grasp protein n=1 Tax=Pseudoalteromonas sp. HF66 TaxID=2721559 RepID=UPI0014313D20|nr:hypothetical protein [Pseudoalteromonas sp. HF66]NIZ07215.1 hypothetical protein [Pseudoalteromonas sp. HF66]